MQPPWVVTLVCGASGVGKSGVGKSSVAIPLAARYGVPLAEADDFVTGLRAMMTAQQAPTLHYWDSHPEAVSWEPERIASLHFDVVATLRPALEAIITDHFEFETPIVFEGDYLTPELAVSFGGAVRAVVIDEPEEAEIVDNYQNREPQTASQVQRARVSAIVGAELARRAARWSVPVVAARPWSDVVDRVDHALRRADRKLT